MIEIAGWSGLLLGGGEKDEAGPPAFALETGSPKGWLCLLLLGWLVFNNLGRNLEVFFIGFCVYICGVCGSVGACVLYNVCGEDSFQDWVLLYSGI